MAIVDPRTRRGWVPKPEPPKPPETPEEKEEREHREAVERAERAEKLRVAAEKKADRDKRRKELEDKIADARARAAEEIAVVKKIEDALPKLKKVVSVGDEIRDDDGAEVMLDPEGATVTLSRVKYRPPSTVTLLGMNPSFGVPKFWLATSVSPRAQTPAQKELVALQRALQEL